MLNVYEPLTLRAQSAKGLKDASAWAASISGLGLSSSKLFGWQSKSQSRKADGYSAIHTYEPTPPFIHKADSVFSAKRQNGSPIIARLGKGYSRAGCASI